MMKIIAGKTSYEGKIQLGHNVLLGYFEQDQEEKLNLDKTVFETIDELATGDIRKNVRNILGSFLFTGDSVNKKVNVLSGGERGRLALCKLLLQPYNLLLLDEPTNHLDIQSKQILKQALIDYEGTVIIVSHDRDFLTGLCNRIFEFKNHKIKEHLCDIEEFLRIRKIDQLRELDLKQKNEKLPENKNTEPPSTTKTSNKNIEKQIKKIEEQIEKLEKDIQEKDKLLANPLEYDRYVNDQTFFDEYTKQKAKLDELLKEWERLMSE